MLRVVVTLVLVGALPSQADDAASRVTQLAPGFNSSQSKRDDARYVTNAHILIPPAVVYASTIPVSSSEGAALFYTFFEARSGDKSAPLILWLQGGPGASDSVGLFYEIGFDCDVMTSH